MDIDDILAEVDEQIIPQESRDLQELTRAWVAERVAPELMSWPEELMRRVLGRIARQVRWFLRDKVKLENRECEGD
jgi:GINS complex subunit 4